MTYFESPVVVDNVVLRQWSPYRLSMETEPC